MTPFEKIENWQSYTSDERRREVFEVLLGIEEFGSFIDILKEYRDSSRLAAQADAYAGRDSQFNLGQAAGIDGIIAEIGERMNAPRNMV